MSRTAESRAELLKLARLLGVEPAEIAYLEALDPAVVRALRERVTDVLFDADADGLKRIAAASRVLPTQIAAAIAQRAFGPLLCARLAAVMEPGRAVEIASRLPAKFLAEVAIELDPRRVGELLAAIPAMTVREVVRELVARDEHVTLGRFVGHVSDRSLTAAIEAIDDLALLRIGPVIEVSGRLAHVLELVSDDRLRGLIETADRETLWPEALALFARAAGPDGVSESQLRLAAIVAADDALLEAAILAAAEQDLWELLLALAEHLPEEARRTVAGASDPGSSAAATSGRR